eukprot:3879919-Prymnesium_polylepis.1
MGYLPRGCAKPRKKICHNTRKNPCKPQVVGDAQCVCYGSTGRGTCVSCALLGAVPSVSEH